MHKLTTPSPAPLIQAARERGLVIKQLQEEALQKLPLNTLYIILWV